MKKSNDITGMRFGKLTVLKNEKSDKHRNSMWLCECDCGNKIIALGKDLRSGKKHSCGCDIKRKKPEYHGMSDTNLYRRWTDMRERCDNPKNENYSKYGAKGVKVCEEWENSFLSFYNWSMENGFKEELSIDRIDPFGNYCPENCRWATFETQINNKRGSVIMELNGEKKTFTQWCKLYSICPNTVRKRMKRGYTFIDALTSPSKNKRRTDRISYSELKRLALDAGLSPSTVRGRIDRFGWSLEDAISVPARKRNKR